MYFEDNRFIRQLSLERMQQEHDQALAESEKLRTDLTKANEENVALRRAAEERLATERAAFDAQLTEVQTALRREQEANQRLHSEVTQLRNIGEREEKTDHLSAINERLESDLRNVRARMAAIR